MTEYTLLMHLGLPGGSKMLILRNHSHNKITRVILNLRECFKREALKSEYYYFPSRVLVRFPCPRIP